MLRRLGGCAVALALLLPTQAMASPSAPAERAQASTTTRVVKLGHTPVRATSSTKVRLVFRGQKGKLVNLARWARGSTDEPCGGLSLTRRGGSRVAPWAPGYWRLPKNATYVATSKPCRTQDAKIRVQVRTVVVHARVDSGQKGTAGRSKKVTHLVPFLVAGDQQASLSGARLALVRPDRTITHGIDATTDPYVVGDPAGPVRYDVPSPRGRYFVELAPRATVALTLRTLLSATVDGAPVLVPDGSASTNPTTVRFTGQAGQWIYTELRPATGGTYTSPNWLTQIETTAADGSGTSYFLPSVVVDCPPGSGQSGCRLTQLPANGTYVLGLVTGPGTDTAVSARVRSAVRAAPATVNGPAVTYTAGSPGQWVVGELPELPRQSSGGSDATVTLSNATGSLGEWRVRTVSGYGPCNPGLGVGCFNPTPPNEFTLNPSTLTSPLPWDAFANPAVAVLAVSPDATGSLDLAVTRPAS